MQALLTAQYDEVTGARGALFSFCRSMDNTHLLSSVAEFNNSNIISLLVHNANTYINWLAPLDQAKDSHFFSSLTINGIDQIEEIYSQVNGVVADFLLRHSLDYTSPITQSLPHLDHIITVTPLQLYTHVITHEFHHKGQILTMSRLLGYTPADTDVIRT
ncbi:DinB family protein [Mucilaginibacter sp. UR6-11]|uniref:DinB family protein n=1 Tax=Mucilaginibacter sp. UR6-11 TaxID=1435644 RepID=UPI001E526627|nr:DinB family protein [Mucilaginibacter sp. UR6-11]MCC8423643.1 hypothetical protein [Mucilaginibacter sp. UR6-11]